MCTYEVHNMRALAYNLCVYSWYSMSRTHAARLHSPALRGGRRREYVRYECTVQFGELEQHSVIMTSGCNVGGVLQANVF